MFFFFYFISKLFCFLFIQLLVCPCAFFTVLFVEFSLILLESPALFVFIDSVLAFLKSPFFHRYLLWHYQTFLLSYFVFIFSSQHITCFTFLSIFASYLSFFTCPSCLISQRVLFFSTSSLGEHRFYHRLISPLNKLVHLLQWCYPLRYLVIFCLLFRFLPWIFSSSASWGMVMCFCSAVIFFINCKVVSSFCFNICFVVLVCLIFRFSVFCVSIRLWISFLSIYCFFWIEGILLIFFSIYLFTYLLYL